MSMLLLLYNLSSLVFFEISPIHDFLLWKIGCWQERYPAAPVPKGTERALLEVVLLQVQQSVAGVLKAESALHLAEVEAAAGAWDGEVRQVSKHSATLTQLDNGVKVKRLTSKQNYSLCFSSKFIILRVACISSLCEDDSPKK